MDVSPLLGSIGGAVCGDDDREADGGAKEEEEFSGKRIKRIGMVSYAAKTTASLSLFVLPILFFSFFLCAIATPDPNSMATLGGIRDVEGEAANGLEIEQLGRFAVDQHNKKENALLEFAKVIKAREQVVAGTLHHLTVEVIDAGKKKIYEAKVWVKPWLNFKELQEFSHVGDSS